MCMHMHVGAIVSVWVYIYIYINNGVAFMYTCAYTWWNNSVKGVAKQVRDIDRF